MIAPGSATRDRMMPSAGAFSVASASEVSAVARSAWAAARLARPAAMSSARLPSSSSSSACRSDSSRAWAMSRSARVWSSVDCGALPLWRSCRVRSKASLAFSRSASRSATVARPWAISAARGPATSLSRSAWRAPTLASGRGDAVLERPVVEPRQHLACGHRLALLQLHLDQPAGDAEAELGLADVDIAVEGQRVALPLAPAQPAGQVEPPAGGDRSRDHGRRRRCGCASS